MREIHVHFERAARRRSTTDASSTALAALEKDLGDLKEQLQDAIGYGYTATAANLRKDIAEVERQIKVLKSGAGDADYSTIETYRLVEMRAKALAQAPAEAEKMRAELERRKRSTTATFSPRRPEPTKSPSSGNSVTARLLRGRT